MASDWEETLSQRDMMMVLSLLVRDMVRPGLGCCTGAGGAEHWVWWCSARRLPYIRGAESSQALALLGRGEEGKGRWGWGLLSGAMTEGGQGLVGEAGEGLPLLLGLPGALAAVSPLGPGEIGALPSQGSSRHGRAALSSSSQSHKMGTTRAAGAAARPRATPPRHWSGRPTGVCDPEFPPGTRLSLGR